MIDKNFTENQSYVTDVKVLNVEKRYRPGPKHYVYIIQVTWTNPVNTCIIYRRYAQFFDLQCQLLDLFAEAPSPSNNYNTRKRLIPFLPGKIFLGRSQIRQVALERRHALDIYCRTLISLPERISRSRPVLEFFHSLPTDVKNPADYLNKNPKSITKAPANISQPSKLPTYRCIDDFIAVEKTEMSLKRNTLVQVVQRHFNGWWFVQNGDRKGFVPGAFLKPTDQTHDDHISIKFLNEPYVVNQTYEAKNRDEISLQQGSFVTVLEKSYTGWWIVQFNKITGQFPAVYLTSWEGQILPESVPVTNRNLDEGITIPLNTFNKQLSCSIEYEHNDNQESSKAIESEIFYVHTDYIDEVGDCVTLKRGDIVEIHEKHASGWWLGRRLTDDFILTWMPSAFLQKEPININEAVKQSSNISIDPQLNITPVENIYQNLTNKSIIYTEILKTVIPEQSSACIENNDEQSTKISVRELVKKFNRQ